MKLISRLALLVILCIAILPSPAPAEDGEVITVYDATKQPAEAASGGGIYEDIISQAPYSVGFMGGYGIKLWDWDHGTMELAEGVLNVAFPITDPVGSGIFHGVLEYKMDAVFGIITNFNGRVVAGGSPVGLRYNFTGDGRLVPYTELMLGAVYLDVPSYVQGTRFNFTENFGVGAQYFLSRKVAFNAEVRIMHLSNAGIKEPNHGINSGFLLVGLSYY